MTLTLEEAERTARELLDGRMAAVRTLVASRQTLNDLRDQVAEAEREDTRLYGVALRDGWSAEELRKIGLGEPEKAARVRRRAPKNTAPTTAPERTAPGAAPTN